jgi:hypothetical protein
VARLYSAAPEMNKRARNECKMMFDGEPPDENTNPRPNVETIKKEAVKRTICEL